MNAIRRIACALLLVALIAPSLAQGAACAGHHAKSSTPPGAAGLPAHHTPADPAQRCDGPMPAPSGNPAGDACPPMLACAFVALAPVSPASASIAASAPLPVAVQWLSGNGAPSPEPPPPRA